MRFPGDINPDAPTHEQRLTVAFAMFVAKLIAEADGEVDIRELSMLRKVLPPDLLHSLDFIDASGEPTAAYKVAYREAIRTLPSTMDREAKLDLVTVFHQVGWADDELVQAELLVIREAAEVLGLTVGELGGHLNRLRDPEL